MEIDLVVAFIGVFGTLIAAGIGFYSNYKNQKLLLKKNINLLLIDKLEKIYFNLNKIKTNNDRLSIYVYKILNQQIKNQTFQEHIKASTSDAQTIKNILNTLVMLYAKDLNGSIYSMLNEIFELNSNFYHAINDLLDSDSDQQITEYLELLEKTKNDTSQHIDRLLELTEIEMKRYLS